MRTRLRAAVSEKEKALNLGGLLELWVEVWPFCHLNCQYCFNVGGNSGFSPELLRPKEYSDLLQQFKVLGGRSIGIPGNGEPLHARNYGLTLDIAKQAKAAGIGMYVFTTGDLVNQEKAQELYGLGLSMMVKCNSFKPAVQDKLVGVEGYTERRLQGLDFLLNAGFHGQEIDQDANKYTRLGLVTSILAENYDELPEIFRWCRKFNVLPDFDTIAHMGRGEEYVCGHPSLTDDRVREMFEELQRIDREEFGNNWEITPTYVDGNCDRYSHHLYIDCWGNVSPCLGANKKGIYLGNLRQGYTLAEAWDSTLMKRVRSRNYSGKCATCRHFQSQTCNSCLGRFANIIDIWCIDTAGCWNYQGSD